MARKEVFPTTLLVVANPGTDRRGLQSLFSPPEYQLFFTNNCGQALADGPTLNPDVILVDSGRAASDGTYTCKRLRDDQALSNIPILMIINEADEEVWQAGLTAGAADLIQKPIQPRALQTRVANLAKLKRGQQNLPDQPIAEIPEDTPAAYMPDLRIIKRVIEAISTKLDTQEILQSTCEMLAQVFPFQEINAWLVNEDQDRFELVADLSMALVYKTGAESIDRDAQTIPIDAPGRILPRGRYPWLRELTDAHETLVLTNNKSGGNGRSQKIPDRATSQAAWLIIPLHSERRLVGFIELKDPKPLEVGREEIELAQNVAHAVGESIEAIQLFQRLQNYAEYLDKSLAQRTRELEGERDRNQAILEALGEAVVVTDLDGTIRYTNQAVLALTGYLKEELLGRRMRLWRSHRQTAELYTQMFQAVEDGYNWRGEVINERKDGKLYDAALTIAPLYTSNGKHTGYVSVQRDITPIKEAERLKDQFISNVSHELRTPLSIITLLVGNLDALYERLEESRKRKLIRDIRSHIQVLNDLISNVLEVSRLDGGRLSKDFEAVNLTEVTREEVEKQLPLAKDKNQNMIMNGTDHIEVQGHESQLRQVVRNLINNAIKYTPRGGYIACSCEIIEGFAGSADEWPGTSDQVERRWAVLRVRDTGIGIDQEDIQHLFERFYRVSTQGNIPGAGLGLSIAKELIDLHNGHMTVASAPRDGSMFTVYLPLEEG